MSLRLFFLLLLSLLTNKLSFGQQTTPVKPKTDHAAEKAAAALKLYKEIATIDSIMFTAVNNCDSVTFKKCLAPDIEFYHDLGGLSTGIENEMKSFKETCDRGNHIRRELVKESLEVHPIKGYGAIEIATHRFYHTNKGQEERLSGTYKFTHIWRYKDGEWKLARVISYGHDNVNNN